MRARVRKSGCVYAQKKEPLAARYSGVAVELEARVWCAGASLISYLDVV